MIVYSVTVRRWYVLEDSETQLVTMVSFCAQLAVGLSSLMVASFIAKRMASRVTATIDRD